MRWLLTLITLICVASAAVDLSVVATVDGDTVNQNATFTITNHANETLSSIPLAEGCEFFTGTALENNSFAVNLAPGETAELSFMTEHLGIVSHTNDHHVFSASFNAPTNVSSLTTVLVLPAGYLIRGSTPITPQGGYSSDGQHIIVVWQGANITAGEPMSFVARYEQPFGPMIQMVETFIPVTDSSLFVPGIVLAFLFGYFLAAGLVGAVMRQVKRIRVNLNPDEKTVVYYLEKHGDTEQAKLMRELDFSKAKLSRLLREMDERGLVKRTPRGKTNLISLK